MNCPWAAVCPRKRALAAPEPGWAWSASSAADAEFSRPSWAARLTGYCRKVNDARPAGFDPAGFAHRNQSLTIGGRICRVSRSLRGNDSDFSRGARPPWPRRKRPRSPKSRRLIAGRAEGAEGAPAKKKMAGKTLILFIILPAVLVLGGGGAAAMMLLGGGKTTAGCRRPWRSRRRARRRSPMKKGRTRQAITARAAAGDHGGAGAAAVTAGSRSGDVGHLLDCAKATPATTRCPS